MKKIGIGIGVLGVACGLWVAVSGRVNPSTAVSAVAVSGGVRAFDYEGASLENRRDWLVKHADPLAKMFNRSLPKGDGEQPHMSVEGYTVDARRREITVGIRVAGKSGIDRRAVPAAKKAFTAQICPGYAASPLGANKVQLNHSFVGNGGREELLVIVSPITCRKFM